MNIIDIYKEFNIKYWTSGKNVQENWVNIQCPFCDDKSNHLGFNIEKEYYYCWRCGHKFNDQVFRKLNIPKEYLNKKALIKTKILNQIKQKKEFILPGSKLTEVHKKYLFNRGFPPDILEEKYKLLGTNHLDMDYKFRIIIPIIYQNKIVSFTGRDYTGKQTLRYKSCPKDQEIIDHKTILYNLDNCKEDFVIVVEGCFDCWRLGDNSCATFGTGVTSEQKYLLLKYKKIIVLFDREKDAESEAENLSEYLSGLGCEVYQAFIPPGYKDIAEMSQIEANIFKKNLIKNIL